MVLFILRRISLLTSLFKEEDVINDTPTWQILTTSTAQVSASSTAQVLATSTAQVQHLL